MLRLYYADVAGLDADAGAYALSDYRRDRLAHIRPPRARRQGIGAELLLNRAAGELRPDAELPLHILTGAAGKPYCAEGPCFSLSHSGDVAACAVSDAELGLDVQEGREYSAAFVRRFFTSDEQRRISGAADRDFEFTKLWALKESYLKALGTGLETPTSSFSVLCGERIEIAGRRGVGLWHCFRDGFHFALCRLGGESGEPEVFEKLQL